MLSVLKADIQDLGLRDRLDNVDIQLFNYDSHFETLSTWLKQHGQPIPSREDMPALGYVTLKNGQLTGAAFLRMVEGGFAQVDGLTVDPTQDSKTRSDTINILVTQILDAAKTLKIKAIYCYSAYDTIIDRAADTFKFIKLPHKIMVLGFK